MHLMERHSHLETIIRNYLFILHTENEARDCWHSKAHRHSLRELALGPWFPSPKCIFSPKIEGKQGPDSRGQQEQGITGYWDLGYTRNLSLKVNNENDQAFGHPKSQRTFLTQMQDLACISRPYSTACSPTLMHTLTYAMCKWKQVCMPPSLRPQSGGQLGSSCKFEYRLQVSGEDSLHRGTRMSLESARAQCAEKGVWHLH